MHVRMVFLVHAKLTIVLFVNGVGANFVATIQSNASVDAFVDGTRENIATIVVSVFADEVDTAWGSVDNTLISKALLENGFQFFSSHIHSINLGAR